MRADPRTIVYAVIDDMLDGATLKTAASKHCGSPQSFARLLARERELAAEYARALEFRAEIWADAMIEIADDLKIDPQRARNMIDARKWNATKANPRKFGERVDLNIQQSIDISATLQEARLRILRPVRDLLTKTGPQAIDLYSVSAADSFDTDTHAALPTGEPDIFS